MQENNRNRDKMPDYKTGKSYGRQGIDKAPGEETAENAENVISNTQKAKNKVDGDPSRPSDQPLDQE